MIEAVIVKWLPFAFISQLYDKAMTSTIFGTP